MARETSKPSLYIIAGPNGAGKTTFAREFLPHFADCKQFVNADLIAQGLSPFSPESAAMRAGRIMLDLLDDLAKRREDFAFETTLSGRGYLRWLRRLRAEGYAVRLFFLWLPTVDIALARVAERVRRGGHAVPEEDVRRRFGRGLLNLRKLYHSVVDSWILFENETYPPRIIAFEEQGRLQVVEPARFAVAWQEGAADG
jgi:predicted ABC-type ATPase